MIVQVMFPTLTSVPLLQRFLRVAVASSRGYKGGNYIRKGNQDPYESGIKYKGNLNTAVKKLGFTYYPRYPDEKDPPYEPSKLFMVKRLKPLKGTPYWDKEVLIQLKLDRDIRDIAIVKNTPEMNIALWQVKHLVKITPITFPNGLPQDGDYFGTFLKETGEFVVSPKLKVDPKMLEEEPVEKKRTKMDGKSLQKVLRYQWNNPW